MVRATHGAGWGSESGRAASSESRCPRSGAAALACGSSLPCAYWHQRLRCRAGRCRGDARSVKPVLLRKHPHGLSRLDNRAELWRRRFLYDFIASWYRGCRFFSVATISQQFFVRLLLYRVRFAKLSAPARFPTRRRQSARVIPMLETDRRCHPDSDQKSDLRRKVDLF
ncbi:unnamed protein product [Prorocentrum cordatum]|uniref:RNA-directed DNA polymerase n=1 Tax=Prorocentrum cordatum TaxID=2364126 RepID=A0ABN9Y2T1_9DINO|nr:unnamed protein product [Polarella glacialis]